MAIAQPWTLLHSGVEKTLADWGVTGCKITRRTQATDVCVLELAGVSFDATEIFAFKDTVTLKRNGTIWFVGTVTRTPRMGRPSSEGVSYEISGPWWWLENICYEQDTYYYVSGSPATAKSTLHILSVATNGAPTTTMEQIEDALEVGIGAGAPLGIGGVGAGLTLTVPSEVGHDLSCAEVIRRMMRWHPDCVCWWDYTATPHPKFYLVQRASLTAANFSLAGKPASGMDVAARPDLVPPVVAINYTQTNIVDDVSQIQNTLDVYPADAVANQVGAVRMTIDLKGWRASYLQQDISTTPIFTGGSTLVLGSDTGYWKDKNPWLTGERIQNLAVVDGSLSISADADGATVYLYALTQGNLPQWLLDRGFHVSQATLRVLLNYDEVTTNDDGTQTIVQHRNAEFQAKVVSTDAPGGPYSQLGSFDPGEDAPTGLALVYWTVLQQLQYEGSFELTEQECGDAGGPWMGRKINLADGISEWASMNELITEVEEDLATGRTRLRFGPPKFLTPQDNLALRRMNRNREPGDRYARATGQQAGGAQPIGGPAPRDAAGKGSKDPVSIIVGVGESETPPGAQKVTVQITKVDPESIPRDLTVKLREVQMCQLVSGVPTMVTMLVMASETYSSS